jgi:hypothetical protein
MKKYGLCCFVFWRVVWSSPLGEGERAIGSEELCVRR